MADQLTAPSQSDWALGMIGVTSPYWAAAFNSIAVDIALFGGALLILARIVRMVYDLVEWIRFPPHHHAERHRNPDDDVG